MLTFLVGTLSSQIILLEGSYQGNDIYIKNPFSSEGVGFCIFEVLVNGEISTDEINSSAFTIDLSLFDLSIGDPVEIVIRTKDSCTPKVINPEALRPRSSFEIEKISLSSDGQLTWSTKNEAGSLMFFIEQFKWNKWVKIGEIIGQGKKEITDYRFQTNLNFGENTVRLRQRDFTGNRYSEVVKTTSDITSEVELVQNKISSQIEFSFETSYEIYSEYGELVTVGYSKTVDSKDFDKGRYYINFGNQFGQVITKK